MKIEQVEIEKIKPYKRNAKQHPVDQVEHIANSIKEFGFKQPIVIDKNNVVVIGHGRLMAAKSLGMKDVPCVRADDLTDEQIKALRLADNKTNESDWLEGLLGAELDSIIDIDMTAFGFASPNIEEIEIQEEEQPEIDFVEVLGEEHNYIVLYFDNEVDWLQAESLFELEKKRDLSTRVDGKIIKSMNRMGLGRVIKGSKAMEMLRRHYEGID